MNFDNPLGLYSLLSLAVLVLAYLIRPRPTDVNVPSIMFLMRDKGTTREKRFFRTFMKNLLFILQFLALASLAFAAASPLFKIAYDTTAEHTVIVLDVSASMQAKDGMAGTRFEKAVDTAKKSLKGDVTLILAENMPLVAMDKGSESKAESILSSLKPTETRSNIGDAVMLAGDMLKTGEGRVIVLSDFAYTEGIDPEIAKSSLEARGIAVDFVKIGGKVNNLGIVDMKISSKKTDIAVKNYFDRDQKISIEIEDEKGKTEVIRGKVLANSIEKFEFGTKGGLAKIRIPIDDDFMADNIAYASNPQKEKIKTLLITDRENIFLKNALLASDAVDITVVEPIVAPDAKDYKVIIFDNFNNEKLLPGTMDSILRQVEKGAAVIIFYQNDLSSINFKDMLPVSLKGVKDGSAVYSKVDNQFTRNVEFGKTDEYYEASADNSTIIVAEAEDRSPVIAIKEKGDGKTVYYGINDRASGFKNSPSYPIFWNYLMSYLIGVENINNFNHKTGKVMAFDNPKDIAAPNGRIKTSRLVMEKAGVYIINGQQHTANIIDETESMLYTDKATGAKKADSYAPQKVVKQKDKNIEIWLLIFGSVLIFAEMFIIKFRGDV